MVKPKDIFYNKHKKHSAAEVIWNGESFDPIPLDDVVPTSVYSSTRKITLGQLDTSSPVTTIEENYSTTSNQENTSTTIEENGSNDALTIKENAPINVITETVPTSTYHSSPTTTCRCATKSKQDPLAI